MHGTDATLKKEKDSLSWDSLEQQWAQIWILHFNFHSVALLSLLSVMCLSHLSGVYMSEVYLWEVGSALLSGPNREFCSVVTEQPSMRKECGIFFSEKKKINRVLQGTDSYWPRIAFTDSKKVINLESRDGSKIYGGFLLTLRLFSTYWLLSVNDYHNTHVQKPYMHTHTPLF